MMRPWIKKQWIEALRSGEYKQAQGKLVRPINGGTGYCCLGVLTDLYAKEHGLEFNAETEHLKRRATSEFLCTAVMRWAGLEDDDPMCTFDYRTTLSMLNDEHRGFDVIADAIEASDL